MEIKYDREKRDMTIMQQHYIKETVELFGQAQARATENPCDPSVKLSATECPHTEEEKEAMSRTPYRQLIGRLLYVATCTRPDIAFAVSQLGRFASNPGISHWKAAIKVLRYLNTTSDHGLHYSGAMRNNRLTAFSDADWGSNTDDRRSVSGVLLMLNGGPVVFKSKYQRTVALSTSEAEYMALSMCTQEVVWARALMEDLGVKQQEPTVVWEDNQGTIALASNPGYHARTKHVDIRHHFIREKINDGVIKVVYIKTEKQLADILTKGLGTKRLQYLRDAMGIKGAKPDQPHRQ
ncbi:hypothetical protein ATCC90586_011926 [Pythium insidiosum]|nr:hypothetical protein ATCC90586_011926 [Pythium insidiosum]